MFEDWVSVASEIDSHPVSSNHLSIQPAIHPSVETKHFPHFECQVSVSTVSKYVWLT